MVDYKSSAEEKVPVRVEVCIKFLLNIFVY